jgi:hypothetical protein
VEVLGERFDVDPHTARLVRAVERLERERFAGDPVFAAPFLPGLYAMTRRESPTWSIYFLAPIGERREREEVERLSHAGVRFAVLADIPLDGRDELRLRRSHPLVWQWLAERSQLVPGTGLPPPYRLYRLRSGLRAPDDRR